MRLIFAGTPVFAACALAALHVARAQQPAELIVAVPVASNERLESIRPYCDEIVCVLPVEDLYAIGQFYEDFTQVDDNEVCAALRANTVAYRS